MAASHITVLIEVQLQRDRALLAALKGGTLSEADLENSGYGTDKQIAALGRKIAENELRLKTFKA